ncbi:DUF2334 domain-containing protein [Geothrix fuzhouensis]|uniref:DUF2334 domain-containing protein n=1 Tax=Geothrix fuzhouensis TaxID=2966451 RepID=UPI00214967F0|nr:DUF2334 domain-containing protein [Geothrix fuzhouensis]
MTRKPRVLFLINSLAAGGAERQLTQLVRGMDQDRFDLHVAVLHDSGYSNRGEFWAEVASTPGVTLHSLHKRQGLLGYLIALPRLINLVSRIEPDILHGYLQGNLTALVVGGLLHKPVAWGIRRTSIDISKMDLKSRILLRIEVRLSRFADLIIFNSQAGFRNHRAMGMHARRMQIIPNSHGISLFSPDPGRGPLHRKVLAPAVLDIPPEARESHSARRAAWRAPISTRFSDQALARETEKALLDLLSRDPLPVQPARAASRNALSGGPRYLLRFDDICPTMDWSTWNAVEEILVAQGVKPILAVVPDNQDPKLMVDPPASDFWDRVRGWQARGWAIGLHGYQHLRVNSEPGILGFPSKSEFAGLPYEEQLRKLKLGLEIFAREGVRPDVWIAPSHSFDLVTVAALRELGIRTISDGMAFRPYQDDRGTVWIPQQYAIMRPMPWGVWTFCYHLGLLSGGAMAHFRKSLEQLGPRMISLSEARALGGRRLSPLDRMVGLSRKILTMTRRQRTRWAS